MSQPEISQVGYLFGLTRPVGKTAAPDIANHVLGVF